MWESTKLGQLISDLDLHLLGIWGSRIDPQLLNPQTIIKCRSKSEIRCPNFVDHQTLDPQNLHPKILDSQSRFWWSRVGGSTKLGQRISDLDLHLPGVWGFRVWRFRVWESSIYGV